MEFKNFDPKTLRILLYPHPMLRYPTKPMKTCDPLIQGIIEKMFQLVAKEGGVGLAATQVGLPLRLFVVSMDNVNLALLNPVTREPRGHEAALEGCLSIPDKLHKVVRPKSVILEGWGVDGKHYKERTQGWVARAALHEIDHLDGVMFTDRAEMPLSDRRVCMTTMVQKQVPDWVEGWERAYT